MTFLSILIPSWNALDAITLCIESILKRTKYFGFEIIVLDSSDEDSDTRQYLQMQRCAGNIELFAHNGRLRHGEALTLLFGLCNSKFAVILDSDVEILDSMWLQKLTQKIKTNKDLGIGHLRPNANYPKTGTFRTPAFHPFCFLINMDAYYEFGIHDKDWKEKFIHISQYKYKDEFIFFNPELKRIHYETGSRFTERVLFENPQGYRVHGFPKGFIRRVNPFLGSIYHFEGMSAHSHILHGDMMKSRIKLLQERLQKLKNE